jgi:hypothetical protein
LPWLDSHGAGYLGWGWDTFGCASFPALISDYSGTPTSANRDTDPVQDPDRYAYQVPDADPDADRDNRAYAEPDAYRHGHGRDVELEYVNPYLEKAITAAGHF